MNKHKFFYWGLASVALLLFLFSCVKETELSGSPYTNAPVPSIKFNSKKINSIRAKIGDTITFQIKGLGKLSPESYTFSINKVAANVVRVTDSLITVKVSKGTSSGTSAVLLKTGDYFYGPLVFIDGKITVDPAFNTGSTTAGTNGPITDLYNGGSFYILTGYFDDYNNQKVQNPISGIVKINAAGNYQTSGANRGAFGGSVRSILSVNNGRYIISGGFGTYGSARMRPSNITQLNNNLSIDSTSVDLVNPDPENFPQNSKDTVPTFNGYLNGSSKLFKDAAGKIIAVGNFSYYNTIDYTQSQKGLYLTRGLSIRNFIRFNNVGLVPGLIDSSYNYSYDPFTEKSNPNLDGFMSEAIQLTNKKIIIAGAFAKFNDLPAPNIMALTDDGNLDPDFALQIGTGTDAPISSITYNSTTRKILISGSFAKFNNKPVNGVVMLNEDGSVDESFSFGKCLNGLPVYAAQLNNSKIIVNGSFDGYVSPLTNDSLVRQRFMILEPSGHLLQEYNNTGAFSGQILGIMEPAPGKVLLYGYIDSFDNTKVGNILQITIAP